MDREALGEFLRRRRESLTPAAVGLPELGRRRTPGLRREEVAGLAYISTDHYTRLEQARGSLPSRPVLQAVARALLLDDAERDHVLALADDHQSLPGRPNAEVPQHVRELIKRLPLTAAVVRDAHSDVLAWNDLAQELLSGLFGPQPQEHNLLRRYFLHPDPSVRYLSERDESQFVHQSIAALRSTVARYPQDERARQLVADLRAGSPAFDRLWSEPAGPGGNSGQKVLHHPAAGALCLNYDILDVPGRDHQIVLLTASPGSHAELSLRWLAQV